MCFTTHLREKVSLKRAPISTVNFAILKVSVTNIPSFGFSIFPEIDITR